MTGDVPCAGVDRTEDRAGQIAARVEAATPGPWARGEMPEWEDYRIVSTVVLEDWPPQPDDPPDWQPPHKVVASGEDVDDGDFEFLIHSRDDVPWLLAERDRLMAWSADAVEYIELLQDAGGRMAGFLFTHGWHEDDAVVQRGKDLRAQLGVKGQGE